MIEKGITIGRDTSFIEKILVEKLLRHFQYLQIGEYMGTSDLEHHLYLFENASLLH